MWNKIHQEWKSAKYRFIRNFEGHFFIHLLVSNSLRRYKHWVTLSCRGTLIFFHSWLSTLNLDQIEDASRERERGEKLELFLSWKALGRRDLFDLITGEQRRGKKKKKKFFRIAIAIRNEITSSRLHSHEGWWVSHCELRNFLIRSVEW